MTKAPNNIKRGAYPNRSYRLSDECMNTLEKMSERFFTESKIKLSSAKLIEISVFFCEKKSLRALLRIEKDD